MRCSDAGRTSRIHTRRLSAKSMTWRDTSFQVKCGPRIARAACVQPPCSSFVERLRVPSCACPPPFTRMSSKTSQPHRGRTVIGSAPPAQPSLRVPTTPLTSTTAPTTSSVSASSASRSYRQLCSSASSRCARSPARPTCYIASTMASQLHATASAPSLLRSCTSLARTISPPALSPCPLTHRRPNPRFVAILASLASWTRASPIRGQWLVSLSSCRIDIGLATALERQHACSRASFSRLLFSGTQSSCSLDELMAALRTAGHRIRRARVLPILHAMDSDRHGIAFHDGCVHLV
jgi:hypothetical protein